MTEFDVRSLTGSTVVDRAGSAIGTVTEVYLDDTTGRPQWVTVGIGRSGRETFVPLAAARYDRDRLVVDATGDQVAAAPQAPADGHITHAEEAEILRYYGLTGGGGRETTGRDTTGRGTDDAMTRSEEHLVARAKEVQTERVRLRKYVVTEMATVQVPVRREEVRLEHEPITEEERQAAYAGGSVQDITEITDATPAEAEVILHAERPVVTTETVAVERVRLGKEVVSGTETVTGEVRKEKIELDDPTGTAHER